MLTIEEYKIVSEDVDSLSVLITQSIIDNAEYYDIEEDLDTLQNKLTIYDTEGEVLVSVDVEDYDTIVSYMEEYFELEYMCDDDAEELDVLQHSTETT